MLDLVVMNLFYCTYSFGPAVVKRFQVHRIDTFDKIQVHQAVSYCLMEEPDKCEIELNVFFYKGTCCKHTTYLGMSRSKILCLEIFFCIV